MSLIKDRRQESIGMIKNNFHSVTELETQNSLNFKKEQIAPLYLFKNFLTFKKNIIYEISLYLTLFYL
jgi:hypothetical protein